ncbi:MAG: SH3 domain-containing protein [Peptococcaceae bacterium]|nr:SH3 domain-containing protein [Peptococcaceae bacterium]
MPRKFLGIMLSVIAIIAIWAFSSSTGYCSQVAVVKGSVVNLRNGPGTNYAPPIGEVRQGDRLSVLGQANNWYKVQTAAGQVGWIAGWLVKVENAPASKEAVVTGSVVNLRSGPGTSYAVVGEVKYGDRLPVLGSSGDWVKIRRGDGQAAWIAGWLVQVEQKQGDSSSSAPSQPSTGTFIKEAVITGSYVNLRSGPGTSYTKIGQVSKGARLPVLGGNAEWVKVRLSSGQEAWIYKELLRIEQKQVGSSAPVQPSTGGTSKEAVVTGSVVNLRGGPGTSYAVVDEVKYGDRLPVLGSSGDWVKVQRSNGQAAWIAGWLVRVEQKQGDSTPSTPSQPSSGKVVKEAVITGSYVNLRSGPGTSYTKIGQVSKGARLPVLGGNAEWVKVRLSNGQEAWIYRELLRVEEKPVSGPSNPPSQSSPPDPGGDSSSPGNNNDMLPEPGSNDQPDSSEPTGDSGTGGNQPPSQQEPSGFEPMSGWVATVNVKAVDVRSHPRASARGIAQATQGYKFPVLGRQSSWIKVRLPSGTLGWVREDEVKLEALPSTDRDADVSMPFSLKTEELNKKLRVIVKSPVEFEYSIMTLRDPDRIVLDLRNLPAGEVPVAEDVNSPVVKTIRTAWFQEEPRVARIVCDLKKSLAYTRCKIDAASDGRSLVMEISLVDDPLKDRLVVLDPGHGGSDPGAIGVTGLKEKHVNWVIAKECAQLLEAKGINVVLTRTGDEFVDLYDRAAMANRLGADIFVSIHSNSNFNRYKQGTSTYYCATVDDPLISPRVNDRIRLAQHIQKEMVRDLGLNDLGLFEAKFAVLRTTHMPSALVEVAFLSNWYEESLLKQESFRDRAAKAIAEGIIAYLSE